MQGFLQLTKTNQEFHAGGMMSVKVERIVVFNIDDFMKQLFNAMIMSVRVLLEW